MRFYNGLGQLIEEFQEHDGAVDGNTLYVGYNHQEMAGGQNNSNLLEMLYPDGEGLSYDYDSVGRLSDITSDTYGYLEGYEYLGLNTLVKRDRDTSAIGGTDEVADLRYYKFALESNGDAGDPYTGLDRFDRVVDQRWVDDANGTGTTVDRFQYGYDRNSNALWKDNLLTTAKDEFYAYDNLNRLATWKRGDLNVGKTDITSPVGSQTWDFDALGNWQSTVIDTVTQNRTHNAQNQIKTVGTANLVWSGNGELTTDESGTTLTYDAWGRVVEIDNGTAVTHAYDALNRRISEGANEASSLRVETIAFRALEAVRPAIATTTRSKE